MVEAVASPVGWGFHQGARSGTGPVHNARMNFCARAIHGVSRGLGLVAVLACGPAAADELRVQCDLTYAGATQTVVARPVADPYTVPSVDVRGRFRFKPVVVGSPGQIERVNLYVYLQTPAQPVLVQQAKYLPPFDGPPDGRPLRLTGEQRVYAGPLERELIYNCQLLRGAP